MKILATLKFRILFTSALTTIATFQTELRAQQETYTRQDTLRGTITPERIWWDLTYYHLNVDVNIREKSIKGSNLIRYKVLNTDSTLQIELQEPLALTKVTQDGVPLMVRKDGYSYFVILKKNQQVGAVNEILVEYEGKPKVSRRPPWVGGLTWTQDNNGIDWVVTTCQGDGASLWWPNKDHAYDEPDSMDITITCPEKLTAVSNGRLKRVSQNRNRTKTFHWFVSNPINNYGVNMNIGDYVHFSETYKGLNGPLDCDYYVLTDNLEKAKHQFKEVPRMMEAFEHWFGPYPFYEDGYKLVEVPYAGMEHQSSVTYGNGYANGYSGRDVSFTGWGMKFDFIIIHESGHEWFANNITHIDVADMWVHEGFTSYSENLFLNYHFGKKASSEYCIGKRKSIANDKPIIGVYNVHKEGSGDMYNKAANMLHTIRQIINDDEQWRQILTGLNREFYHQTVSSAQVEQFMNTRIKEDISPVFDQYLRETRIPILEYKISNKSEFIYRWINCVKHFQMPVKVMINKKEYWLTPSTLKQTKSFDKKIKSVRVDPNFYVKSRKISEK